MYSGSDENGQVWIANGNPEDSKIIGNASWSEFQNYELYYAGGVFAQVRDANGLLIKIN